MKPFTLLIKPASADCNLRCSYCFYLDRAALYPETTVHRMSDETLERLISSYMATPQPEYIFGWQGGEPLLMGLDFYKRVTDLQKRHGSPGVTVANGLQTNGVLITDDLARHFAEYKFLLGVSLDGPEEVHDHYRRNLAGAGSYATVRRGIDCLQRHQVAFNILTLVTPNNARRAAEIYSFLCAQGFRYHQYIPCVEFDEKGKPLPWTLSAEEWGGFLCELFDLWFVSDTRRVSIRLFDSILAHIVDHQTTVCHMGNNCCVYFVVEHNGDVYPCDFFVQSEWRLGNIHHDAWDTCLDLPLYLEFGRRKSHYHTACKACKWAGLCAGDCQKHRVYGGDDPSVLSWLCRGWQQFFTHTAQRFEQLADEIRKDRAIGGPAGHRSDGHLPKRNDLCPCGSGRKYKHCCLLRASSG